MGIDLHRSLHTLALPALLLLLAYVFRAPLGELLLELGPLATGLPYLLLSLGLGLSLLFRHSREFFNLLLLLAVYAAFDQLLWPGLLPAAAAPVVYGLICLLLPLNLVINDILRERGILNRYGAQRLLLLIVQIVVVGGLVYGIPGLNGNWSLPQWLPQALAFNPTPWATGQYTPIPPLALLTLLLSGLTLTIYVITHPGPLQSALLVIFVAAMLALNFAEQRPTALLLYTLIGVIILLAIVQNSHYLAYKDELTQLPTRRALKQHMMALGSQYSIAMVDVDHFKKLNDTYGHDVGDQVLRMLATQLRKVKGGGKAYRYGGEEFTVIFSGKPADQARPYLDQLRELIAGTPFVVRQKSRPKQRPEKPVVKDTPKPLKVTVSIGVADQDAEETSTQDVIKAADKALYKAKQNGRNRVV